MQILIKKDFSVIYRDFIRDDNLMFGGPALDLHQHLMIADII